MYLLFTYLKNIMHWKFKKYTGSLSKGWNTIPKKKSLLCISPLIFSEEPGGLRMLMYLYRAGASSRTLVNTVPCKAVTTYSGHKFYKVLLGWPNCSFGFFPQHGKTWVNFWANPVFLCLNVYTLSLAMLQGSVITFTASWRAF